MSGQVPQNTIIHYLEQLLKLRLTKHIIQQLDTSCRIACLFIAHFLYANFCPSGFELRTTGNLTALPMLTQQTGACQQLPTDARVHLSATNLPAVSKSFKNSGVIHRFLSSAVSNPRRVVWGLNFLFIVGTWFDTLPACFLRLPVPAWAFWSTPTSAHLE